MARAIKLALDVIEPPCILFYTSLLPGWCTGIALPSLYPHAFPRLSWEWMTELRSPSEVFWLCSPGFLHLLPNAHAYVYIQRNCIHDVIIRVQSACLLFSIGLPVEPLYTFSEDQNVSADCRQMSSFCLFSLFLLKPMSTSVRSLSNGWLYENSRILPSHGQFLKCCHSPLSSWQFPKTVLSYLLSDLFVFVLSLLSFVSLSVILRLLSLPQPCKSFPRLAKVWISSCMENPNWKFW